MTQRSNECLRVAALPLAIEWGQKEANLAAVEEAFAHLPEGTDIVVLPELFSTGYADDPDAMADMAERNTGPTVDFIKRLAARHSTAIAGSFLASTPPKLYNRGFFIEPSGEETFYDKRHLFSLSSERRLFAPGNDPIPTVRFRGWTVSMIVCYDLRFPVWCRSRRNAYDILLVAANWPKARGYAWEHLLIARAIENQCAVVGANRGGSYVYGSYEGLTHIYDCRGMELPQAVEGTPFVVADISRAQQADYRHNFPVGNDADDFDFLR